MRRWRTQHPMGRHIVRSVLSPPRRLENRLHELPKPPRIGSARTSPTLDLCLRYDHGFPSTTSFLPMFKSHRPRSLTSYTTHFCGKFTQVCTCSSKCLDHRSDRVSVPPNARRSLLSLHSSGHPGSKSPSSGGCRSRITKYHPSLAST